MKFFDKLKSALKKTSEKVVISITGKKPDEDFSREIEDSLIMADVGVETAAELAEKFLRRKFPQNTTDADIKRFLADEICKMLLPYESNFFEEKFSHRPEIILVIGVNGNGKTTTVAKIAYNFKKAGKNPLPVAADTFRAAAVDQLKYWADKIGVDICIGKENADAAGLVYDAIKTASTKSNDVVLIDTAGRMQNRADLLDELEKIKRVIKKIDESAPHKTVLVLDGTTGQAAHNQVDVFLNKIGIDGIIITKLDGTAKGGAIISLTRKYKIPVFAVGVGEGLDDLKPFDAKDYSYAIFGIE
ncbi:MAG: signal recognition particle-docking protein FtsY [Holosporaceae bacterium]|jgi:fused signal recognition particle receptor|nr:signal recognition particle-docking protein FtsY [Holosporaceae bacterium]